MKHWMRILIELAAIGIFFVVGLIIKYQLTHAILSSDLPEWIKLLLL